MKISLLLLGLLLPVTGYGTESISPAKEMSISKLFIPFFSVKVESAETNKAWNEKRPDVQEAIVKGFTEHSAIEPVLTIKTYPFDSKPDAFKSPNLSDDADAILLGECHETDIEIKLVSAFTGRNLGQLKIPVSDAFHQNPKNIAEAVVDAFLFNIKYVGFITATHNGEAKINVGTKLGIKKGQTLVIFDFDGNQPTITGHIHRLGVLKVSAVTPNAALGNFTASDPKTTIGAFAKVALPRTRTKRN